MYVRYYVLRVYERVYQPISKTRAGHKIIPTKDVFQRNFFCNDIYLEIITCARPRLIN